MAKRKYTKKSDYWKKFDKTEKPMQVVNASFEPELLGEPFYTSDASYTNVSKARKNTSARLNATRTNTSALSERYNKYSSIRGGMLPYEYGNEGVSAKDGIELCQLAYANVAIFRNAVDIMSELANTDIYLEGGSKKSREFFTEYFKRINLINLKDQYFREFYKTGNVFFYRFDGTFKAEDYLKLMNQIGSFTPSSMKIPVKYTLLNPRDMLSMGTSSFYDNIYKKVLSKQELNRLKNPQTQDEKDVFDALDQEVKEQIKDNSFNRDGVKIKLDPKRLSYSFYKKQDYEPFAIPFGFPVLADINAKLELKKMDQAITRTVENVILLITMGTEPEKGGINPNNINAMQSLFMNESVGRVLVSDYTTKADFIIPDLKKVLGPEKYTVLNEDIKQGLQNVVVGEEKFNSTQVKTQIFLDRLKDARTAFLNDFLQKEIKRIANDLGLKSYPTAVMKDVDMRDEVQLMRVATRLMELGIITPQQGMDMFKTGKFPKADDIKPAQKSFIEERKEGLYNPIVGGIPMISPEMADEEGGVDSSNKNRTPKSAGRPRDTSEIPLESSATYSRKNIQQTIYEIESLANAAKERSKEIMGVDLSQEQEDMIGQLVESIVCSTKKEKWTEQLSACLTDFNKIEDLNTLEEILSVSSKHGLEDYPAAILYHSKNV